MTDSSGALLGINRYDEYGIPQSTNLGKWGYTGQAWLPELGMQYSKARIYSPALGRFLQPDPIGYADGVNLYAYVGSDPVNFVDPQGTAGCTTYYTYERLYINKNNNKRFDKGDIPLEMRLVGESTVCSSDKQGPSRGSTSSSGKGDDKESPTLKDEVIDQVCQALAEGNNLPTDVILAAIGGVGGWLGGTAVEKLTAAGAAEALRRHELTKPVIGSRLVSAEARMAIRGGRAGLMGAAAGAFAGYYFEDEINKATEQLKKMCKQMAQGG